MQQANTATAVASAMSAWAAKAACQGMQLELFYPPSRELPPLRVRRERRAKALCARCPVRVQCLEFARQSHERFGIWGGLTGPERQRLFPDQYAEEETEATDEAEAEAAGPDGPAP